MVTSCGARYVPADLMIALRVRAQAEGLSLTHEHHSGLTHADHCTA